MGPLTPMLEPRDPRVSTYVFASGKKGRGKSHVCRAWFDAYPLDRVVIDVTHDVGRDLRADGVPFTLLTEIPASLPRDPDHQRRTWVYQPDMGSPTAVDDMDRIVGLCLAGGRPMLLWVDEVGALCTGHYTPPNMRRVLHHGRHARLTVLMAGPRAKDIDVLCIAQADLVYTFRTPQKYDRETIARAIGVSTAEFDAANARLGEHDYTLFDDSTDELWICPALPARQPPAPGTAPPVPART